MSAKNQINVFMEKFNTKLQSCPIVCINEPDTHSTNTEILQTTPESTLEKPRSSAAATVHSNNNNNNNNSSCITINAAATTATATAAATSSTSSSAGVTKITITSDNSSSSSSNNNNNCNNSNIVLNNYNSNSSSSNINHSNINNNNNNNTNSLISITSLNSCSNLSNASTATLALSSNSSSSSSGSNRSSCSPHGSNSSPNGGSDTSSANFQERFDFDHWKSVLTDLSCFNSLYRYWNQCNIVNSNSSSNNNGSNSSSSNSNGNGNGNSSSQLSENDAHDTHGSFYTHNILGYTFGYPFGLKEDVTGSVAGDDSNSSGVGFKKSRDGSSSHSSSSSSSCETPLQKHYRQQQKKKMPVFRGRRAWCGCFKRAVCSLTYRQPVSTLFKLLSHNSSLFTDIVPPFSFKILSIVWHILASLFLLLLMQFRAQFDLANRRLELQQHSSKRIKWVR